MTALPPVVRLEVMVGLGAVGGDFLTLDDPVKGELDEATYPLYDPSTSLELFADMADYAFAYSYRRGRATDFDEVNAGTLSVNLRNHRSLFLPGADPDDPAAEFDPDDIKPGQRVRLYLDEATVFDGIIDDWDYTYPVEGGATASLVAFDQLAQLAATSLDEHTATLELPGDRINAVLDRAEVAFPAGQRAIQDGDITLQADTVSAGTNTLTYLQTVARSGDSVLYVSPAGVVTSRVREDVTYTLAMEFADDGTGVPFSGISPQYGSERLVNRVSATRVGGAQQVASDASSQALYGIRTKSFDGLLMAADGDAYTLASRELTRRSTPVVLLDALTVTLPALDPSDRINVLNLDIGDTVRVTWTPEGTSTPTVNTYYIEGIEGGASVNSLATVSFTLSPAVFVEDPFILNSATDGVLNTDTL